MDSQKINGIVLSVTKYKDYDTLCAILTENGIKKVKFTGVRRPNAKMAFASQPFFCGEFLLSGTKDYSTVTQVSQTEDFFNLTQNYDAYIVAFDMLKLSQKIATDETQELFNLLIICLKSLTIQDINVQLISCYFHTKVLQILGVWQQNFECSLCGKSLNSGALICLDSGELFCKQCANQNTEAISKNVSEFLSFCSKNSLSNLLLFGANNGVVQKSNELLTKLIKNLT